MALSLGPIWRLWAWWEAVKFSPCPSLLTISNLEELGRLGQFLNFHPLPRYVNVPGLFGQPNIANILSWHYLWDPYGGFEHDGSSIQPALPPYHQPFLKELGYLGQFSNFHPLPRYVNVFLDCLANLILPISRHGIIFGTHMEALGVMGGSKI